ncbi:hypothetical protein GOBAR_AA27569 [Gossypium barbadense]|uniref:Uncharacterized protein n=1 Tax=Gossypium barbadense TaxID=3634 RepID=A0A2P5WPT4_GOSBA|nr:hypothetical protein GOBAR_AA27569 [Gossypium barbadense]
MPQKNVIEPRSSLHDKNKSTYEERRLQIDELDEWRNHVKEKPRTHDVKPKPLYDEFKDGTNQFNVGNQVLLDEMDSRITTLELNANGVTLFTALNVFSYSTVEATHSHFSAFR